MIWKTRKDKPELNRKMLIVSADGRTFTRTYTENTPLKQVLYATKCVKWAYIDEIIELLDQEDKKC